MLVLYVRLQSIAMTGSSPIAYNSGTASPPAVGPGSDSKSRNNAGGKFPNSPLSHSNPESVSVCRTSCIVMSSYRASLVPRDRSTSSSVRNSSGRPFQKSKRQLLRKVSIEQAFYLVK